MFAPFMKDMLKVFPIQTHCMVQWVSTRLQSLTLTIISLVCLFLECKIQFISYPCLYVPACVHFSMCLLCVCDLWMPKVTTLLTSGLYKMSLMRGPPEGALKSPNNMLFSCSRVSESLIHPLFFFFTLLFFYVLFISLSCIFLLPVW